MTFWRPRISINANGTATVRTGGWVGAENYTTWHRDAGFDPAEWVEEHPGEPNWAGPVLKRRLERAWQKWKRQDEEDRP